LVTLVTLGVIGVVAVTVTINSLYVNPPMAQPLMRADAVVVLGGTPYKRFEYGIELAERGLAPEVVISNSVGSADTRMQSICSTPTSVRVTCFLPQPWTTRGEAQEIRSLAQQRGWKSIIVVTTKAHISRARYILGRCFGGEIMMTDYPEKLSVIENVTGWIYQSAGWVRALTQRGC
jgi:uncharacterized SAM-binding protein YcdF (DUF218 family)